MSVGRPSNGTSTPNTEADQLPLAACRIHARHDDELDALVAAVGDRVAQGFGGLRNVIFDGDQCSSLH